MGLNLADIKEIVLKLRTWHWTSFGRVYTTQIRRREQSRHNMEFSLMTYNILSQDLITGHPYLYDHCSENALKWPQRGERIIRELREAYPDFICLQEMHNVHYEQLYRPVLESIGYSGVYKKRTGEKCDGCALFYKRSTFKLEKSVEIEFNQQETAKFLNRDNVALIGAFKPTDIKYGDDWQLIIATTHLLFNPRRGDIKLAQLRMLLAELDKLKKKDFSNKLTFCLLCGDMNAEPQSPLIRFIRDGKLDTNGLRYGDLSGQDDGIGRGKHFSIADLNLKGINLETKFTEFDSETAKEKSDDVKSFTDSFIGLSKVSHNFNFRSVYPYRDFEGRKFVSTYHSQAASLVDYIFYTSCDRFQLLGYRKLLTNDQMSAIGCLPNEYLGSDHLSLNARFAIHWSDYTTRGGLAFLSFMHMGTAIRCFLDAEFLRVKVFNIECANDKTFHHIYAMYSILNALLLMQSAIYLYVYPLTRLMIGSIIVYLGFFLSERFHFNSMHTHGSSLFPFVVNGIILVWVVFFHYIWKPWRRNDNQLDLEKEVLLKYGLPIIKPGYKSSRKDE
ncbi:protein angel 2-like isoform X1 [Dinothrombium tinctorium]|uniref:Protein angel 2-like isoform X1 n=1 Tax=Dinothrombium tinctorium TaxID=1965070 RepID=A0A3S4QFX2_9ACAR|nr:protein angel 2-like isoform X1 [Dinothrombium tinctorium]